MLSPGAFFRSDRVSLRRLRVGAGPRGRLAVLEAADARLEALELLLGVGGLLPAQEEHGDPGGEDGHLRRRMDE